jgi:hypothetical protein
MRNRHNHSELVVAGTYPDEFSANLAKTALDAAGIESMIRNYNALNYPAGLGFELVVAAENAGLAKKILST